MTQQHLCIETQKDEIIARLILQRVKLQINDLKPDMIMSLKEAQHVMKYSVESDKKIYSAAYRIAEYVNAKAQVEVLSC